MLYRSFLTSAIFQWFENTDKLIQIRNFLNHKNPLNLSPNLSCTSFSPSDFHEGNYTKDPIQSHGDAPSSALSMNRIIHPPIRQHHTSSRTASLSSQGLPPSQRLRTTVQSVFCNPRHDNEPRVPTFYVGFFPLHRRCRRLFGGALN